jgi:tetratricopeptide (TPR) repeat protein
MRQPANLIVGLMLLVYAGAGAPRPATDQPASGLGKIIIVRPPSMFGEKKPVVIIDGMGKGRKLGSRTLAAAIEPGTYQTFGVASAKPAASLRINPGEEIYLVKRGDRGGQRLYADLSAGRTGRVRENERVPAARKGNETRKRALVTLVCPPALFGTIRNSASVDGKDRTIRAGTRSAAVEIEPGTYECIVGRSAKPRATIIAQPGEMLYVVDDDDARSQRLLGDIMFDNGARAGAFARYRRSIQIDSAQLDIYKRYSDLALEFGGRKEAIAALQQMVSWKLADGQTYQTLGDLLLKENRTAEAQAMYDAAIAAAGDNASVLADLGAVKRRSGDLRGAAFAYEKAVRIRPDSTAYYEPLGDLYMRVGDTLRAIQTYQSLFQQKGTSSAAAYTVGAYYYRLCRFEDAVHYLLLVKGKQALRFEYLRILGESYYNLAQYGKAANTLRVAAGKYPQNAQWPVAAELLIKSYMALNDYAKAAVWVGKYTQTTKKRSNDVAFYRAYLAERTSAAAARTLYEKNLKEYPSDHRNFLRLGLLAAKNPATLNLSASLLKKAISIADTVPETWLEIARVYRKLDRPDDELAALRVFIASRPQDPEANARIGEVMLRKGKTDEAVERLEAAEKAGSDDPQVLSALAKGYMRSGKQAEAMAALERAKQGAPNDVVIRQRLIDLYQAAGQKEKVLSELKELLTLQHDTPTLLIYARCAYAAGEYADAANAIEDIRATDPQNIEALMLLGKVLRAQHDYPAAIEIYKEVSFIDASYDTALFERAEAHFESSQPLWAELFYTRTLKKNPKYAQALLGLAKVAKLRTRYDEYRQFAQRAHALAPDDPVIGQEYELSMQDAGQSGQP